VTNPCRPFVLTSCPLNSRQSPADGSSLAANPWQRPSADRQGGLGPLLVPALTPHMIGTPEARVTDERWAREEGP